MTTVSEAAEAAYQAAPEYLDLRGIAALLRVAPDTPSQWRQRGRLPVPDVDIPHKPAWRKATIRRWAEQSPYPRWPPGAAAKV